MKYYIAAEVTTYNIEIFSFCKRSVPGYDGVWEVLEGCFGRNFLMMSSSTIAMRQKKKRHSVTPIVFSGMILLTMLSLGNMAKVPTRSLPILLLATGAVLGCGSRCSSAGTVPQISPNSGSAEAFVKRLIIQGVLDVLEQQGRAAGLPDFV
ncbi:hypothetical protein KIN20_000668 [Parelaphostrongylus tenuis]|uniref:Uncharacterized protein n=1 Tax=Parelaphostrongylus tenuis TaxID=148309 RepID=A0AAD5MKZ4_PARTN|nr:hypothetical protein KIN20_000668 [Parelaphostrongylus tenuis]